MMKTLIAFSAALLFAGSAQAAVQTFNFTASVDRISFDGGWYNPSQELSSAAVQGGTIALGDKVYGQFRFDDATRPSYQYEEFGYGQASYPGGALQARFSGSGPSVVDASPGEVFVSTMPTGSNYPDVVTVKSVVNYPGMTRVLGLRFDSADNSLLNSPVFPGATLWKFNDKTFTMEDTSSGWDGNTTTLSVSARLISFGAVSPVPEPSMAMCMLASLGLLAWRRKRSS
jgi:hypothetical protein